MTRNLIVAAVMFLGLALIWALLSWEPIERESSESMEAATDPTAGAPSQQVQPAATSPGQPIALRPQSAAPALAEPTPVDPARHQDPSEWPLPEASGPVAQLKQAFESEPRDSNAVAAESAIHTGLVGPAVHPALVESVLCRTSVCRVRMRWTKERAFGFMAGLMHIVTDPVDSVQFESNLGIDQPGEPNAAGERTIDVYLKLRAAAP